MRWPSCSEALKLCCLGEREVEGTESGREDKKEEAYKSLHKETRLDYQSSISRHDGCEKHVTRHHFL